MDERSMEGLRLRPLAHWPSGAKRRSPPLTPPLSDSITDPSLGSNDSIGYSLVMLDFDVCTEASLRRDPTFDGRFFVAVRTTGIYCRPICPAPHPKIKNVIYYETAFAAERNGFRPCLRCRPETAPFSPAWKGTQATVERALRLIEEGALDRGIGAAGRAPTVDALADRLGVGPRHLARLFACHIGASPLQVARTVRVRRAKRLLTDTDLPISRIAPQAGFGSVRRMNAAFVALYGRAPSTMRGRTHRPAA